MRVKSAYVGILQGLIVVGVLFRVRFGIRPCVCARPGVCVFPTCGAQYTFYSTLVHLRT